MKKILKRIVSLFLVLSFCFTSMAAVVSDNDGSAFITKAEFDSLKNDFQAQIDQYNTSIDNKIDGAISAYLAGITVNKKEKLEVSWLKIYGTKKISDMNKRLLDLKRKVSFTDFMINDLGGNGSTVSGFLQGWSSTDGYTISQHLGTLSFNGRAGNHVKVLKDKDGYYDSYKNVLTTWSWTLSTLVYYNFHYPPAYQVYSVINSSGAPAESWPFADTTINKFLSGIKSPYDQSYNQTYSYMGTGGYDTIVQSISKDKSYDILTPSGTSVEIPIWSSSKNMWRLTDEYWLMFVRRVFGGGTAPTAGGPSSSSTSWNTKWSDWCFNQLHSQSANDYFDYAAMTGYSNIKATSLLRNANFPTSASLNRNDMKIPYLIFKDKETISWSNTNTFLKSKRTNELFNIDADIRTGVCLFSIPNDGKLTVKLLFENKQGSKTSVKPYFYVGTGAETKFADYKKITPSFKNQSNNTITLNKAWETEPFNVKKGEYIFLNWDEDYDTGIKDFGVSLSNCEGAFEAE